MGSFDWILELGLVGLLGVTLVHAIRLERALKALRQDRTALGEAIAGFDDSARQAEAGINRLQTAASESAHTLGQRIEQGSSLRDDLQFLIDRGTTVADRLDLLVRATRNAPASAAPPAASAPTSAEPKVRSQAERELLLALRGASS
jgi:hypothetical protein